ncbi:ribonuclease P protein subunit p20-like isoform X1 [Anthonomus grandis grandis]|uniref:ribonuclease P protein subunit p20-like isoform X1 n=1 Tax=Anthonomus grandis grandis TaxID=2921223 RepID=UPI0021667508|nr:ribonuclease P protein subunit p20-like isoform X1 [Anthonomus grandis grandis]
MADSNKAQHNNCHRPKKQDRPKRPNHVFRKRQPPKPETGPNVIYVSTKTSLKALLERCTKLVNNNEKEIIVYCLGAAIQKGILLALQVAEKFVAYQFETNTFSTTLIDDLEPTIDEEDYELQKRFNSALRIRIFRTDPLDLQPSTST